jgi:radical SAM superfamily enzyme YgiQ (UPF0313 family)
MTQINTPYPATAYLKGFLKTQGREATQADPALELVLSLFSKKGLERVATVLESGSESGSKISKSVKHFLHFKSRYLETIDAAIRFLQGKDPSLALRVVTRNYLPEGPRFHAIRELEKVGEDSLTMAFGYLGVQDQAKYLATLFLDDVSDVIREGVDPKFALTRYGEKLAASQASFEPLWKAIHAPKTLVDEVLEEITLRLLERHEPDLIGMTAPFPGNIYGAFRMAALIKRVSPKTQIVLGGGYPNTELRELKDPRVFDFFDFITLDDGEKPFSLLLSHLEGKIPRENLLRTYARKGEGSDATVAFYSDPKAHDIPHRDTGTPSYEGLPLDRYLSILEMLNPMHRIWSDGRWNKLTLAHGCYWKKCNFCDVSLDYIGRYDPASADLLVDRIEAIVRETGQSGFHFVDEAAPPAVLRGLAERLIARGVQITWWGNIRFEKTFDRELTELLAKSGCVAVSGGLEVASDRLLKLMNKGVTVEQVARVTHAFTQSGVMVHAYLMYGFPTQTVQETLDALERVRQLFEAGCIQSAFWHRFSATIHSPIGRSPEKFGIKLLPMDAVSFARNDLFFSDPTGVDHDFLGEGLRRALYNYMHGIGFEEPVTHWFPKLKSGKPSVPKASVNPELISRALSEPLTQRA